MAQTHHYLFDTAAAYTDQIGTATITNVNGSIDSSGKVNQCYLTYYDMMGSYSAYTSNNVLPTSGAFSIAFWVKGSGTVSTSSGNMLEFYNTGSLTFGLVIKYDGMSTGKVDMSEGANSRYVNNGFDTTNWTHLVFVYDGAGSWTIYVNGSAATMYGSDFTPSGTAYSSSSRLQFSSNTAAGAFYFDDLRIYDSAIDGTEVSFLYNSGSGTQSDSGGSPVTATYTKFNPFIEAVMEKVHNLSSDQLKIALTNTAPSASNSVLADLTEISYTNLSSRNVTTSSSSQTSGTYKLVCADLTLTATGSVGPFRYIVLYNDTATSKNLIAYYDYGSSITMQNGDNLAIDFDGSNGVFTAS